MILRNRVLRNVISYRDLAILSCNSNSFNHNGCARAHPGSQTYSCERQLPRRKPNLSSAKSRYSRIQIAVSEPVLDKAQFEEALSQLLPRFKPVELANVMVRQADPLVCLELFNWASQQPRFKHDVCTYHVAVRKLGEARMYHQMDAVVSQLIEVPCVGNEALFNTIIYLLIKRKWFSRAVVIFKHMKGFQNSDCRPSLRTYNTLINGFLRISANSYINQMRMDTVWLFFREMLSDGIEPDIFTLNSMVKGFVLSHLIDDAHRIFKKMGALYKCLPNALTYDFLIHGMCVKGKTNIALELLAEMKSKGFVLCRRSYNSLVNALVLKGEVDEAVELLREMIDLSRVVDSITYRTMLDELCRRRGVSDAKKLLEEFRERDSMGEHSYRELLRVLNDDYTDSNIRSTKGNRKFPRRRNGHYNWTPDTYQN